MGLLLINETVAVGKRILISDARREPFGYLPAGYNKSTYPSGFSAKIVDVPKEPKPLSREEQDRATSERFLIATQTDVMMVVESLVEQLNVRESLSDKAKAILDARDEARVTISVTIK